jgi:antirestriction protein ArdC
MKERESTHKQPLNKLAQTERSVGSDQEGKLATLLVTLERGIEGILDSAGFASYLRTMGRFPTYSAPNVALILVQRPDATRVAGYRAWQALGRQVKKGETGIRIFVPFRRRVADPAVADTGDGDDTEAQHLLLGAVSGFGVGTVFDVAQTEGEPLPSPPVVQELEGTSEIGTVIDRSLARFLLEEGLRLTKEDTGRARGYYRPDGRLIAISDRLAGDQQVKTLIHEAAHYLADHRGAIPTEDAETVAESAAFVVMSHFRVDTGAYSFPYVANWARDKAVLRRNFGEIQQVASRLIMAIEDTGRPGDEEL